MKKAAVCLVCLALATVPRTTASGLPADQSVVVSQALTDGAYALAMERAKGWCAEVEASYGPDSIELARATDLLVEALIKNGDGGQPGALTLAERTVKTKEARLGIDQGELAISLENLGAVHDLRGEFRSGLPLHERALAIRRHFSDTDAHVADSLDAIANSLIQLSELPSALQRLDESLRIRERELASSPIALARTLSLIGQAHRDAGRYPDAVRFVDRALALWASAAPEHPEKALVLTSRGDLYYLQGDVPNAHRTWTEALALTTRTLAPDHPIVARVDRALAFGEESLGNLTEARRLRELSLSIDQSRLHRCQLGPALNDLANSFMHDGDYVGARRLYDRQRTLREGCLGRIHPSVATAIYNQFVVADHMGAVNEAAALGYRAIEIWTKALGPTHPFVAFASSEVAGFEASRKHYAEASVLFERALRIRKQVLGSRHPDVALTLTDLAKMQGDSGQITSAFRSIREAIDILTQASSREPDLMARALAVRGSLEQRQGQYDTARATLADALARREQTFGPKHAKAAETRSALGEVEFELGAYDDALSGALSAEQIGRDLLRFTIGSLPERRAMEFAAARPRGLDLALSIAAAGHASNSSSVAILDSVVRSRGVVLEELAARARPAAADPQIASLVSKLSAARTRFANLTMRSVGGESVPAALLEQARQQKEDAEEALAEQSASARSELAQSLAGLDDVRRALPSASALVSFVRYERTRFVTIGSQTVLRRSPWYIAFVVRTGAPAIAIVPLGTAASIDASITNWRQALNTPPSAVGAADAERAYRLVAARLRASIWDPLSDQLRNVSQIFIVPDGAISMVSFAALPAVNAEGYLIERAPTTHYLTTERDLLMPDRAQTASSLLAVGNPDFGNRPSSSAGASARSALCGAAAGLQFGDLPGARAEAREVANLWGSDATVLTGREATKAAAMRMVQGRRVVHFATHGFFLDSPCDRSRSNTRAVGGLVRTQARTNEPDENPLLLSGLAFAGANRPTSGGGIGNAILTAEEIVGLNLQDAEWVVLSACDTGLGAIRAGEGVFGLRRAFQIAGARTVIMSLWSVDDQATRQWMRALYEARITQHLTTSEAVRAAGLRVLLERRVQRASTHPFYWAAFVAAGDWR